MRVHWVAEGIPEGRAGAEQAKALQATRGKGWSLSPWLWWNLRCSSSFASHCSLDDKISTPEYERGLGGAGESLNVVWVWLKESGSTDSVTGSGVGYCEVWVSHCLCAVTCVHLSPWAALCPWQACVVSSLCVLSSNTQCVPPQSPKPQGAPTAVGCCGVTAALSPGSSWGCASTSSPCTPMTMSTGLFSVAHGGWFGFFFSCFSTKSPC